MIYDYPLKYDILICKIYKFIHFLYTIQICIHLRIHYAQNIRTRVKHTSIHPKYTCICNLYSKVLEKNSQIFVWTCKHCCPYFKNTFIMFPWFAWVTEAVPVETEAREGPAAHHAHRKCDYRSLVGGQSQPHHWWRRQSELVLLLYRIIILIISIILRIIHRMWRIAEDFRLTVGILLRYGIKYRSLKVVWQKWACNYFYGIVSLWTNFPWHV